MYDPAAYFINICTPDINSAGIIYSACSVWSNSTHPNSHIDHLHSDGYEEEKTQGATPTRKK